MWFTFFTISQFYPMQFLLCKVRNNLTMVEKSHLQYLSLNFLKFKFRRLKRRWEWLGNRKVSHAKIISLTQQLDKDKSILDLVTQSKKQQFLQTTYYIKAFNIPRKWFTSDRQLRLNSHDLFEWWTSKHRWELWAILEVREEKHSAEIRADLSLQGEAIFL